MSTEPETPPTPTMSRIAAFSLIMGVVGVHRLLFLLGLVCGIAGLGRDMTYVTFGGFCMIAAAITRGQQAPK